MNWAEELIDLYEKNSDKAGIIEKRNDVPYVLLPPFHTTVTAQIEVTINENGTFMRATAVDNSEKFTIIPITEKSGSRTAGKEPHPLCDNLKYLAGDYKNYCADDGVCYDLYIEQLEKWCQSDYPHKKVRAIYLYLMKGTLIKDLLECRVLKLNEKGILDEKETIQGIPQTKAFVRFIIRSADLDAAPHECWTDQSLQQCYIEYSRSLEKKKGICYLSGNMESITYLHSKKIRNEGDGAKLISANDSQNFTYRGRFAEKEEAFAVGNETSQKMHNALKWIIRKQGRTFDTLTIVTWESNKLAMPRWDADTDRIVTDYENDCTEWYQEDDEQDYISDGNPITAEAFCKALNGYGRQIHNTSTMILLGVDAATTGRLSLVEAKTLESARYLENIRKWHESCEWVHEKWKDGKRSQFRGMVGVRDVADILFGMESKGILTIVDSNGKKLYAEVAKRLIPCIWDGQRIPYDYVQRAIIRASNPLAYKERVNWERVLTLACSMIKKHRQEIRKEEEWKVALDRTCRERDYLYGRLLAIADRIEYRTYDKEKDGSRVTNAKRYMNQFSQRPFETWKVIEENIQPYLNKLNMIERRYYENQLDEINQLFSIEEYKDNCKLNGLYLLGFHSQSYDLKNYKQENKEEE